MGKRRLDLLIQNCHKIAMKLKVETTDYNSLIEGLTQAEDYKFYLEADEAFLVILCTKLPMHYNYQGSKVKIIWIVSEDFTTYEIVTVNKRETVSTENNRFLYQWTDNFSTVN